MSKELENNTNIYDKALESVMKHHEVTDMSLEIEALKRAKKVEEELEEYKISDKSKEESSMEYYNLYKETKRKLKKVKELLELYQDLGRRY